MQLKSTIVLVNYRVLQKKFVSLHTVHLLCGLLNDSYPCKFTSFCGLTIEQFDELLQIVKLPLTFENTRMRRSICPEERLLITLRFLATGESYASLHLLFRVGKSAISGIVRCTCSAIWQKLQPKVMTRPSEERWLQVAAGFQTVANYPNCLGAVDGKHVRVKQPPHSGSRFFNYKKYFSVILMAVADSNCMFVAIDVGAYGSLGDSRVLQASQIGLQVLREGVTLPAARPLPCSTEPVPFVMVSDKAFPIMPDLLRPYPRRELDPRKRIFNFRMSRARRVVECTFGIMCSQWRVLNTVIQLDTPTVDLVIKACCVLHNYSRSNISDVVVEAQQAPVDAGINWRGGFLSNLGAQVRDLFADYLITPEGAVPWQNSCVGDEYPPRA
ncbi:uncharacterized protein [Dendropsophus ebraccatus]|uniref:uncharacterized protein n=1 Tax=Dendropsophus ebraccatus TaxID=150705 RepID=UPI003831D9B8